MHRVGSPGPDRRLSWRSAFITPSVTFAEDLPMFTDLKRPSRDGLVEEQKLDAGQDPG